jgi:hypothetical protein
MEFVLESSIHNFQNKRIHMVYIANNTLIVRIDIFLFNTRIVSNLLFVFILYLLLYNDLRKIKIKFSFI